MTRSQIAHMVKRGIRLARKLAQLETELKALDALLVGEAMARPGEHIALADPEREGTRWLAPGPRGTVVPIIITADKLIASVEKGGARHEMMQFLAEAELPKLYVEKPMLVRTERDGMKFRAMVREVLPKHALDFIELCKDRDKDGVPKNDVKVMWNDAGPEDEVIAPKPKGKKKGAK